MGKAAGLAAVLASILCTAPGWAEGARESRIRIAYERPRDAQASEIHRALKARRLLEGVRAIVGGVRLPRSLTLRLGACAGEANAWYAPENRTVTVCYEYIQDLRQRAPPDAPGGARQDAIVGPIVQVFLHETGHALFDLLAVPLLGREEDAADQFAALVLLQLPPAQARRVIDGSTHLFRSRAADEGIDEEMLADDHGLPLQRLYNLLCLAYGADRRAFAYLVDGGSLPRMRAQNCEAEYDQAAFAMGRLFRGHLPGGRMARAQIRRAFRGLFRDRGTTRDAVSE
ncbi:DUF4344 domain-containing metallopeptidase [Methylobacterium sp. ID0610]|uniref:DUF4344 domain-containing metallopeptidase n=1 Tax=Methylobacterium carpenticola TaxID=3344827 RepID=UPI00369F10BA